MVAPTKIAPSGWNLNRYMVSAGCLFTLVVCPTSIGGEIDSFTGADGSRIFSNTRIIAIFPPDSPTLPEPGTRLRIRKKDRPPAGIARLIDHIARKHGMDPELVKAVARVESNYNPTAVSPKGALGVMQLLPKTAERFGVANPYDPAQNIEGGIRYLKFLRDQFPGNLSLVLAAYNAGGKRRPQARRRSSLPRDSGLRPQDQAALWPGFAGPFRGWGETGYRQLPGFRRPTSLFQLGIGLPIA